MDVPVTYETFEALLKKSTGAVDVFENVLADHPDANFLDVILFNYGRCLFKLDRKPEARKKFQQLIDDYPESAISPEANKIVEALTKAGF